MKLLLLALAVAGAHAACSNCNGRVGTGGTCTSATDDLTCTAGSQGVFAADGTATQKATTAVPPVLGNVLNNASAKTCIACSAGTLTCTAGDAGADNTAATIAGTCLHGFYKNTATPAKCDACNGRVGTGIGTCTDATNDLTCAAGVLDQDGTATKAATAFALGKVLNNHTAKNCIACSANTVSCTAHASTPTTAATTSTACRSGYYATSATPPVCASCYKSSAVVIVSGAHPADTLTAGTGAWRTAGYVVGDVIAITSASGTDCQMIAASSSSTSNCTINAIDAAGTVITCSGLTASTANETTSGHCVASVGTLKPTATTCSSGTVDLADGCPAGRNAAAATEYSLAVTARQGTVLNNHASAKCIQCKPNAKTCTAGAENTDTWSHTTVTACLNGFFKSGTGASAVCTACKAASGQETLALTCTDATNDLTCIAGVDPAPATATKFAVAAVVGHVLNNATAKQCMSCKANTKTCTAHASTHTTAATTSTECHPGFYISSGACVACAVAATTCGADAAAKLAAGLRDKTNEEACPLGTETAIPATVATACVPCATGAAACAAAGSGVAVPAGSGDSGLATSCKSGFTAAAGTCGSTQFGTPPTYSVCSAVISPAGTTAPGIFAALLAAVAAALRM